MNYALGAAVLVAIAFCAIAVWSSYRRGQADQQAADLNETSKKNDAMLQASADAPHTAADLDKRLRDGQF